MRAPMFFTAVLVTLTACSRNEPDHKIAPVEAGSARLRIVKLSPSLLESGRVHLTKVARRRPSGAVRLPADVVATAEGAAEAGTLVSGRIARFDAREGDAVKRGQVLAWLDAPEAARAVADLIRARTRAATQARKVARLDGLVASEAAAQTTLDEARLELDLARADLAAARTLLGSLGLAEPPEATSGQVPTIGAQVPVRSPVDGVVVERNVALGAHVTPEMRLFRLVSEGRVLVEARLVEGADVAISSATRAFVQERGGDRCAARVLGVLPQVEASTRSRKVRLAPDATCKGLTPGAQVEVELEVAMGRTDAGADDVLVIPARAVLEMKSAPIVFVATGEPGVFEVRPTETKLRIGDDVIVGAGVTEGDSVVDTGAVLLKGELMRAELGGEE